MAGMPDSAGWGQGGGDVIGSPMERLRDKGPGDQPSSGWAVTQD